MKKIIIVLIVIILAGIGLYFFSQKTPTNVDVAQPQNNTSDTAPAQSTSTVPIGTAPNTEQANGAKTAIGTSVEGRDITAYHYGQGDKELLFVGGIHGGYEWNTILVAYQLMDYLAQNPAGVPGNVRVTVIPVLNPDGLNKTIGTTTRFTSADVPSSQDKQVAGRFNAHNVDLNRNFDCDWKSTGTWQNKTVSGGSAVFSEPESQALKKYVETSQPAAVVAWYSAAGGVFASSCHHGVLPETVTLTSKYAAASGYPAHESFDFYEITGDMVNWLAKNNIPAISVLLTNHTDTEWTKNQAGIEALFKYYAK